MKTTLGLVPIANFVMFPALDMLIHKWGLAKVTGQDTFLSAGLSDACFGVVQIGVEMWREKHFSALTSRYRLLRAFGTSY